MTTDILIYVEDPGAVNYIRHLPSQLQALGLQSILLASGPACDYLNRAQIAYLPLQSSYETHFETLKPQLLMVGTSTNAQSPAFELIELARKRGLPTLGFVDVIMNAAYRFKGTSGQPLHYAPDYLIVPDSHVAAAFIALGFPSQAIVISGQPHFENVFSRKQQLEATYSQQQMREKLGWKLAPGQPAIVFAAEPFQSIADPSAPLYQTSQYSFSGRETTSQRTLIALEEFLDALKQLPLAQAPFKVVRLHPKNRLSDFAGYEKEIDAFSIQESALECLYAADSVVGLFSMIVFEAILLNKPTLSIILHEYPAHWIPAEFQPYLLTCHSRAELLAKMPELMRQAPLRAPDINIQANQTIGLFLKRLLTKLSQHR